MSQINRCAICMEKFPSNINEIYITKCNHEFHQHCIRKMYCLYGIVKCPLCRASIEYTFDSTNKKLVKRFIKEFKKTCMNSHGRVRCHDMITKYERNKKIKYISEMCEFIEDYMEDWTYEDEDEGYPNVMDGYISYISFMPGHGSVATFYTHSSPGIGHKKYMSPSYSSMAEAIKYNVKYHSGHFNWVPDV